MNPPVPTKLKLLRGNPSKRPINKNEPKPPPLVPNCPSHIRGPARREWKRLVDELAPLGLATTLDRNALAMLCDAFGRWVAASDEVRRSGMVLRSPQGFPIQSPYCALANKAWQQMQQMLGEFGMTPSSRSRLTMPQPDEPDEMEQFERRRQELRTKKPPPKRR
jgi:P27 family predicted phage terminase small subunit